MYFCSLLSTNSPPCLPLLRWTWKLLDIFPSLSQHSWNAQFNYSKITDLLYLWLSFTVQCNKDIMSRWFSILLSLNFISIITIAWSFMLSLSTNSNCHKNDSRVRQRYGKARDEKGKKETNAKSNIHESAEERVVWGTIFRSLRFTLQIITQNK